VDPEVLTKAPLFAELDEGSAAALEQAMGTLRLTKGEILFREGETEDRLYVVVAGKIKLGRSGSAGRENLLAVLGPGQMFGELSVFDPGPRSTTATAVTAVEIRTLEHDELMHWIEGHPEVARSLLGQLAGRLRRANDVVADLVFSDVPGRVAKQLLELARRFGDRKDDGVHVHHDLTQEELAQLVGASRETSTSSAWSAARASRRVAPADARRTGGPARAAGAGASYVPRGLRRTRAARTSRRGRALGTARPARGAARPASAGTTRERRAAGAAP
jgi:CRP/FNR family cyclic AMP-dependent transcriptional regulator